MTKELAESLRRAAEVLISFGAKEVYVFGSAATDTLRDDSDIDMAVSGLPPEVFFKAYAHAVECFPDREMDLIDLDYENPFTRYLKNEGELRRVG